MFRKNFLGYENKVSLGAITASQHLNRPIVCLPCFSYKQSAQVYHTAASDVRLLFDVLKETKHLEANPELVHLYQLDIMKKRMVQIFESIENTGHTKEYVFPKKILKFLIFFFVVS
jgi:hypothetical protein